MAPHVRIQPLDRCAYAPRNLWHLLLVDFAEPSLSAVAATANKCLHGVPGASFEIARRTAIASASNALKRAGFIIYAGQGGLSGKLFRISTMGNVTAADIDRLLGCIAEIVR